MRGCLWEDHYDRRLWEVAIRLQTLGSRHEGVPLGG